jgi:rfaE bifunctional protein kinase chain/domain
MITLARFNEISSQFKSKKILVYGDIILDRYIFGQINRISPEAPVPILKIDHEECRLGGAGNVSSNIDNIGARALLMGVVGKDIYAKEVLRLKKSDRLIADTQSCQTLVKTRVISQRQQIIRIDREAFVEIPPDIEKEFTQSINKLRIDGIIVSDYAKGTVSAKIINMLKQKSKEQNIPIIVDPKPINFGLYHSIGGITPNQKEAEEMINKKIRSQEDAARAAQYIRKKFKSNFAIITRGEQGITASEKGKKTFHIPAVSHEVYDVTGAGDTVVSLLTLALAAGASLKEAVFLSNAAASIVIEKIGTAQVRINELRDRIEFILDRQREPFPVGVNGPDQASFR